MYGMSTVDGFLNVKDGVDEMIKYLANEPSVGLYFVQQHAQASMPYLLGVKDKVVEKVHEVTLHTEDIEDSINVVKSMAECGLPIADEMIKDINRSLLVMSTSRPKRGLINNPNRGFQVGSSCSSSELPAIGYSAGSGQQNGGSSGGYLSSVFNSAKQKAAGLRWPQPGPLSFTSQPLVTETSALSTTLDVDADELPVSSLDEQTDEVDTNVESSQCSDVPSIQDFDKFKSDREAKFEAWLEES